MGAKELIGLLIVVLMVGFFTPTLQAAPTQENLAFFKGKVLTYIVATKPGGGYDAYARLIGKFMEKQMVKH